jgi:hypothetical protein
MANNNKTYQQWWTATSDKVYQLLAHGRWFSPGTPASSTTKTGRHDIAEMLLKVALSTKSNRTDVTSGAGTANPGRAERYIIDFFPVNYYLLLVHNI